jgi:hydrogenase maturation protease
VLDAIDFHLPPGTVRVLRDTEVPAWSRAKLSAHQTGFNDLLALARLRACAPQSITVIGVQPAELNDFGGSLRDPVRARIPEVVELAAREIATWGYPGMRRSANAWVDPLGSPALAMHAYESGTLPQDDFSRFGDPRLIARRLAREAG